MRVYSVADQDSAVFEDPVRAVRCGGVGLNAINAAARRNCRLIVAVDIKGIKKDIAMKMGATHFIDSSQSKLSRVVSIC